MIKIVLAFIAWVGISAAVAQTLQATSTPLTGASIVTACSAGNNQILVDTSGSCVGTTALNYTAPSGNPQLVTTGGGNLNLGTGFGASQLSIQNNGQTVLSVNSANGFSVSGGPIIAGTASLTALTTGTNADFLCLQANGTVLLQTSACTISSLRFKPDWQPYQYDAMSKIAAMDVGTFHLQIGPNADPNAASLQAGLSAESVAAIAPECAIYENDMKTPKSYRQECVIALLVKAIQQLKKSR